MPYDSSRQRRWAHTPSAKARGFPTAEFDAEERRAKGGKPKGKGKKRGRRKAKPGPLHAAMMRMAT